MEMLSFLWKEGIKLQVKNNGTVDRRTLSKNFNPEASQYLPTKNGFVQIVFREVKIINGCVSTKK